MTNPKNQTQKLDDAAVDHLRGRVRGTVLQAGDDGYEQGRRIWNGMIDRHPALIVRCRGTADVIASVNFARDQVLPVSVRGGGHNVAGGAICEGGVVIDLSEMRSVRVDPVSRVASVSAGARLGDVDHEAQAFGLAVPAGLMSETGIAGLALHGGFGMLARRHGLTSDNLVGADVVTADGALVQVNEHRHSDLFWALRGGGGSFGVVTRFEFQAHPVGPDICVGMVFYPADKASAVLPAFRERANGAADDILPLATHWTTPHGEPFPREQQGVPTLAVLAAYTGPVERGEQAVQPFRTLGEPLADLSGPMPFLVAQRLFDADYPNGRRYYWKSTYLNDLDGRAIDVINRMAASRPSSLSSLDIWTLGGAFGRVKPDATAFHARQAPFLAAIEANWDDPAADAANVAWVRETHKALQPFSPGGTYLNFPGFFEEGDALLQASFGPNYERLRKVKATYDPHGLFGRLFRD